MKKQLWTLWKGDYFVMEGTREEIDEKLEEYNGAYRVNEERQTITLITQRL